MDKILVLGDIHGRTIWKDIIKKENPDKVIFLGDYVTSHEGISGEDQISNLEEILKYKEDNPDSVILLRGNHCLHGLGYYWAECSPHPGPYVLSIMNKDKEFGSRFLADTQWIYIEVINKQPTVFSHAGISKKWLTDILKFDISTPNLLDIAINSLNSMEPSEKFGFTGGMWDGYGTDPEQSCTWIRPNTLRWNSISGYNQVVGHTNSPKGCSSMSIMSTSTEIDNDGHSYEIDSETDYSIWMCDALADEAYLIIENGIFKPRRL